MLHGPLLSPFPRLCLLPSEISHLPRICLKVAVCTPGRMIDLLKMKACTCLRTTYLVFDEADRMFDMGFEPQVLSASCGDLFMRHPPPSFATVGLPLRFPGFIEPLKSASSKG